jgi:hypothetical protein
MSRHKPAQSFISDLWLVFQKGKVVPNRGLPLLLPEWKPGQKFRQGLAQSFISGLCQVSLKVVPNRGLLLLLPEWKLGQMFR